MLDLIEKIERANVVELEKFLKAVLRRYAQLFPDWDISTIAIDKTQDRNEQLDQLIALVQKMKTL